MEAVRGMNISAGPVRSPSARRICLMGGRLVVGDFACDGSEARRPGAGDAGGPHSRRPGPSVRVSERQ